jgi:putative peptide zinc metalloprotease protein
VGEPAAVDALVIVDQSEVEFIRPGQSVEIKLNEYRAQTLAGQITQVAQIDLEKVPLVLSHKTGGELPTVTDKAGRERPIRVAYQARVPLSQAEFPILSGFHGRAKVEVGSETLGRRVVRYVRQTFLF